MTKTFLSTVSALATSTTLLLGLAACASTQDADTPSASAPSATEPAATEAPVIDPADKNADGVVSKHEKQIAAKNAVRDYTLADGTTVSVDPKQPLPAEVKAAVKAETSAPVSQSTPLDVDSRIASYQDLTAVLSAESARTGHGIVLVYQAASSGEGLIWVPAVSGLTQATFFGSSDSAVCVE